MFFKIINIFRDITPGDKGAVNAKQKQKHVEDVPIILEKIKNEILMIGKYLNAIKQAKTHRGGRHTTYQV